MDRDTASTPAARPVPARDDAARLTHDERAARTHELLERARTGDDAERAAALDEVVVLNMRVAQAVARRYRHRGLPLDDLTQIAYAALVRAVHEFDPTQGRDLLSYAVPSMTGEIRRWFRDQGWVVRPPRAVQRAHGRLVRSGQQDRDRIDDEEIDRLADEVGEERDVVAQALRLRESERALSLDSSPLGAEGLPLASRVAGDDRAAERSEARLLVQPALQHLSPLDRQVLVWRFVEERSQRDIAARLGCSQVQVSRLLQRLMATMRDDIDLDAGRTAQEA